MSCVSVRISTVQRAIKLRFEFGITSLSNTIEIDQLSIHIIDDLAPNWFFGKEHSTTTTECLREKGVFRNQWQDMFKERLLAPIV